MKSSTIWTDKSIPLESSPPFFSEKCMGVKNFPDFVWGGGRVWKKGKAILRGGNHVIFDLRVTFLKKLVFVVRNAILMPFCYLNLPQLVHFRCIFARSAKKFANFFARCANFFVRREKVGSKFSVWKGGKQYFSEFKGGEFGVFRRKGVFPPPFPPIKENPAQHSHNLL